MRRRTYQRPLRLIAMLLIAAAILILAYTLLYGANSTPVLAANSTWGGVPVGGLTASEAIARIEDAYSAPLEMQYLSEIILVSPDQLGFVLDSTAMADIATREAQAGFLARLWNKEALGSSVELQASVDGNKLRRYLENEIAPRYDRPAQKPQPIPGTTNFTNGGGGWELDVQKSSVKISKALMDPVNRSVKLEVTGVAIPTGDINNLEIFLKQTITNSGFNGIAEIYLQEPVSHELLHFAIRDGDDLAGDIAFSAASTIKIPIMVSVMRRTNEPAPAEVKRLVDRMIELSENPPADSLMQAVIDPLRAPLEVTSDMQDGLGLQNTFLAGFFYLGAELLQVYKTPANTRSDVNLDPDIYNQTTASDMGTLLAGIYTCSKGQESILTSAFAGEITQDECQYMLDAMARNQIGVLSEAGVPDGTRVAHKHGWTEEADGYLHTISDVGIVFSPGADFVFAVFLYDYDQLLFDPANELIAQLVQVMYNYYNSQAQETWLGEPVVFP